MTQSDFSPSTAERLARITTLAREHDGQPPFSDLSLVEWRAGTRSLILVDDVAAAIVSGSEAELVVIPDARGRGVGTALLEQLIAASPQPLRVWAHGDHPAARALAASHGLVERRRLLQLRVPVQARPPAGTTGRLASFRPGVDDAEWLRVNALAFAHHPEQGAITQADLDALVREPWFVAGDFLLLQAGTGILGFCWLKIEREVGEIYALGVDPAHQGVGLGRELIEAGFSRLAERGISTASLYVEADNAPALALYRSFGFEQHSVDIQYAQPNTE